MTEQPKPRVFSYNGQTWDDPGAAYTNDDVRKHLSSYFPELANASVETAPLPDGRQEVKFVKKAGTKAGEAGRAFVAQWLEATGQSPSIDLFLEEARGWETNLTWAENVSYGEIDPDIKHQAQDLAAMYRLRAQAMREAAAALQREGLQ